MTNKTGKFTIFPDLYRNVCVKKKLLLKILKALTILLLRKTTIGKTFKNYALEKTYA